MDDDSVKPAWQSKTMWASAISVLAPIVFPPAGIWIAAHPEVYSAILGAIFGGLRFVTDSKVTIT